MSDSIVLGVDIGGSHITSSLVSLPGGKIQEQSSSRLAVDSSAALPDIITSWAACMSRSIRQSTSEVVAIGIAIPGPFDYEAGICLIREQDKFRSLYKADIRALLAEELGVDPHIIFFLNDACSFLKGELVGGALRHAPGHAVGITLGTGLGSAFADKGSVVDADLWCARFRNGIAEDYLSSRWFLTRWKELTGQTVSGVREMIGSDPEALQVRDVFDEFSQNLAGFLATCLKKPGATQVVIGGNIALASRFFLDKTQQLLDQQCPGSRLVMSQLGEAAALIGSAGYAGDRVSHRFHQAG